MNKFWDKIFVEHVLPDKADKFDTPFYFHIIWADQGTGKICLDNDKISLSSNVFALIAPEEVFSIQSHNDSSVTRLSFSIEYLQIEAKVFATDIFKLFISNSVKRVIATDEKTFNRIQKIKDVLIEVSNDSNTASPVTHFLLNAILLTLIQVNQLKISIPDKNIERMHDFFLLVFQNCLKQKRVSFYADKLNISTKRLNQILYIFSNHSASYFIQENIVMEAKRRLLSGKLNINEIAFELGYEDVAYFSRFFKKWTGMSPEKYRKQLVSYL